MALFAVPWLMPPELAKVRTRQHTRRNLGLELDAGILYALNWKLEEFEASGMMSFFLLVSPSSTLHPSLTAADAFRRLRIPLASSFASAAVKLG
jgi:hypothetical protein